VEKCWLREEQDESEEEAEGATVLFPNKK